MKNKVMKANEVPEKIYLDSYGSGFSHGFHTNKLNDNDIEYIRKDAFIKRACDAYCKVCGHYPHTVPTHICRHDCRYFSDFKDYIKGE